MSTANEATTVAAKSENTQPEQTQRMQTLNASERFMNKVISEFTSNIAGGLKITDHQKRLAQGYFIIIDAMLQKQERDRVAKNKSNTDHKFDNPLPMTWQNVNLKDLALDVVYNVRMGLDMTQKNHIFPIPFRNKKTNKYDITLMPGYSGKEHIAMKYAREVPRAITIELVYSTDEFTPLMKSVDRPYTNYTFVVKKPFDRGKIVGGFGYIEYADPLQNKLVWMSIEDIEKRKPEKASPEFWGGTVKRQENGQWVEVEKEGWYTEMCEKTLRRAIFSNRYIPIDPEKIDENYLHMKKREADYAEQQAEAEIETMAGSVVVEDIPEELPPAAPPTDEDDLP